MIRRLLVLIPALAVTVLSGTARAADDAAAAQQPPPAISRTPDFLLGAPKVRLGLRGAWVMPRAGGDLFSFVGDQLTFEPSDLRTRGVVTE